MNEFKWVLFAALAGHAMGRPFNGLKEGHVQQVAAGRVEGFFEKTGLFPDRPEKNVLPGLHGSLGQRLVASLAVAEPDEMARGPLGNAGERLLELAGRDLPEKDFGGLRDPGKPLRRAVQRWREFFPWTGEDFETPDEESEGIGPAILGLTPVLTDSPANDLAVRLARQTHLKLMPLAAAAAVEELARLLLEETKLDGEEICRELARRVEEREKQIEEKYYPLWQELEWGRPRHRLAPQIDLLATLIREENDELAIPSILKIANDCQPEMKITSVQHGFVPAGLLWAFYRALGPLSAMNAVEDVLNRGRECSAIAALVASLKVLKDGPEVLPDAWYRRLETAEAAVSLLQNPRPEAFESWIGMEQRQTAKENAMREELRSAWRKKHGDKPVKRKKPAKKEKPQMPHQAEVPFPPPPHLWLKPEEELDPEKKKILKEQRARRRIDWKEERRQKNKNEE